jgi:hypothetical protein
LSPVEVYLAVAACVVLAFLATRNLTLSRFGRGMVAARDNPLAATASAEHLEYVRGLGADQVIDYKGIPFEQLVREVDVIFDTVGGETLSRSWALLKPGGRMVTIGAGGEKQDEGQQLFHRRFLAIHSDCHLAKAKPSLERLVTLDKVVKSISEQVGSDTLLLFTADHGYDLRIVVDHQDARALLLAHAFTLRRAASRGQPPPPAITVPTPRRNAADPRGLATVIYASTTSAGAMAFLPGGPGVTE